MNVSFPSENILRLRELTERLSSDSTDDYKAIVRQLKAVFEEGKDVIDKSSNLNSKIKYYEAMCQKMTNILTKVKI